jgi:chromosome segregation ATPase
MSSNLKDILGSIEQLEKYFDEYQQTIKKNSENIIQNLSLIWKRMKLEQYSVKILEEKIEVQNGELTELTIKSEDLDKKLENLKSSKNDLQLKVTEAKDSLEQIKDNLKAPKLELENLLSKLNSVNEKIATKENENSQLEQKKIDNENREKQLRTMYTEEKMQDLDFKLNQLKRNNYFTSFLIENSEEEVSEVDIIATIMEQGSCNLDELKGLLSVPPIMAVRTIKQLAVKGIIKLDEDSNVITMP